MPWEVARRWTCDALKGAAANEAFGQKTRHVEEIAPGKVTRNAAPLRSGRDHLSPFTFHLSLQGARLILQNPCAISSRTPQRDKPPKIG
jgi:hypothetical protein